MKVPMSENIKTTPDEARAVDPPDAARAGGLRYVTDAVPGIRRRRSGKGFSYLSPDGRPVKDPETLARIRALAIPPAWVDVWICPYSNGHLQAVGRDARGRKQYRYHDRWRELRDEAKFDRLLDFARMLPKIRRRVDRDLARKGLSRDKVVAAVVRLLDTALVRIGNPEYARDNDSYGLVTLRDDHVRIRGSQVRFDFRGKAGKFHSVGIDSPRLARVVRRCRDLPGQELFQYLDEGEPRAIGSDDVNEYLRQTTAREFTSKDFRTWAGTVLAARELYRAGPFRSQREARRNVIKAVEVVARQLGNTPAIARGSYVHPEILEACLDGSLLDGPGPVGNGARPGLRADERWVLELLRRRLKRRPQRRAA